MNRFFGKRLQKLAIAGFVACAALAPVFQVKAVQDFILSDVAMALFNQSLIELDRWRNFVAAFSALLAIAGFLVFGFLYCVATSARLSVYFKGAGDELESFFHNNGIFNKRNGRILLAIFAAAFIGFFALMRSGVGYADDYRRQITGSFGWMPGFGRVVTEVLNLAIHGAYLIHDRSPLGQLIAMGFLSVAALVMALAFSGLSARREDRQLKWRNVAAAMILVFNPYFLSCFAFKYDSPGMGISILFALLPFLFIHAPRLYTVSSFACTLGMYMSYQASSGIYIMMVIFVALLKYLAEEWTLSEAAKFCARSAALFIAASAVFLLLARFLAVSGVSRSTEMAFGSNIARNVAAYIKGFAREFNGLWKLLSALVAIAAGASVCSLSKRKKPAALALFALALVLTLILSLGAFVFLEAYPSAARYRYGAGVWLAMLASVATIPKRKLLSVPSLLLAWSFFTYASAFGNAQANQMKMAGQYADLVRQDINEYFSNENWPELSITFTGALPWSGEASNLAKKYPITESLIGRGTWDLIFFLSYFDPAIAKASIAVGAGLTGQPSIQPIGKTTLLLSRRYYNILIEDVTGRVIVECRMEES